MPRKKAEQAPMPETVTLTLEVDRTIYDQIIASTKMCGFDDIKEWLMEAIMDKV